MSEQALADTREEGSFYLNALVSVLDCFIGHGIEFGGILPEETAFLPAVEVFCLGGFRDELPSCFLAGVKGGESGDGGGGEATRMGGGEDRE